MKRVLVVDDEEGVRTFIAEALIREGLSVSFTIEKLGRLLSIHR